MRIVAGAARGRRLRAPAGRGTRPTADRVREALFSSLQPRLGGAHVLDLYAGSGALGLEALSRGAARVVFVESNPRALRALRDNVAAVGLDGAEVVAGDVSRVLAGRVPSAPFDLVLLDPPYAMRDAALAGVLTALVVHLEPGGLVVVERDVRDPAPAWPPNLLDAGSRHYGDTVLHRARTGRGAAGERTAPRPRASDDAPTKEGS